MFNFFFREKRKGTVSFMMAAGLHIAVIFFGSFAVKPAEYGIEQQMGGLEVSLTAAMPGAVEKKDTFVPAAVRMTTDSESDLKLAELLKKQEAKKKEAEGDGSSKEPGKDATTFYSKAGALTPAKARAFRNRPPHYPRRSIELNQEGVVLLHVLVNSKGEAAEVKVKNTSGFPLLDESAVTAIRKWKFEPAKIGAIAVDFEVDIPVRFSIEDYKKSL